MPSVSGGARQRPITSQNFGSRASLKVRVRWRWRLLARHSSDFKSVVSAISPHRRVWHFRSACFTAAGVGCNREVQGCHGRASHDTRALPHASLPFIGLAYRGHRAASVLSRGPRTAGGGGAEFRARFGKGGRARGGGSAGVGGEGRAAGRALHRRPAVLAGRGG